MAIPAGIRRTGPPLTLGLKVRPRIRRPRMLDVANTIRPPRAGRIQNEVDDGLRTLHDHIEDLGVVPITPDEMTRRDASENRIGTLAVRLQPIEDGLGARGRRFPELHARPGTADRRENPVRSHLRHGTRRNPGDERPRRPPAADRRLQQAIAVPRHASEIRKPGTPHPRQHRVIALRTHDGLVRKRARKPFALTRVPQRRPERAASHLETRRRNAAPVLDLVERHDAVPLSDRRRLERPGPRRDIAVIQPAPVRHHAGSLLEHPSALLRPLAEERVQPRMVVQPRVSPDGKRHTRQQGAAPVLGAREPFGDRVGHLRGRTQPARSGAARTRGMEQADLIGVAQANGNARTGANAQNPVLPHHRVLPPPAIELPEPDGLHTVHGRELCARTIERVPIPTHRLMADDQPVDSRTVRGDRQGLESATDRPRRERHPHSVHGTPKARLLKKILGPRALNHSSQSAGSRAGSNSRNRGCVSARCQANHPPTVSPVPIRRRRFQPPGVLQKRRPGLAVVRTRHDPRTRVRRGRRPPQLRTRLHVLNERRLQPAAIIPGDTLRKPRLATPSRRHLQLMAEIAEALRERTGVVRTRAASKPIDQQALHRARTLVAVLHEMPGHPLHQIARPLAIGAKLLRRRLMHHHRSGAGRPRSLGRRNHDMPHPGRETEGRTPDPPTALLGPLAQAEPIEMLLIDGKAAGARPAAQAPADPRHESPSRRRHRAPKRAWAFPCPSTYPPAATAPAAATSASLIQHNERRQQEQQRQRQHQQHERRHYIWIGHRQQSARDKNNEQHNTASPFSP